MSAVAELLVLECQLPRSRHSLDTVIGGQTRPRTRGVTRRLLQRLLKRHQSMLLRTDWIDAGVIWAYTADWLHSSSITSTSKYKCDNRQVASNA